MEKYSKESYEKKIDAIFKRFPSIQKVGFGEAYKPGLGNIEAFEAILGNPHENFRTIHVAGTNGKGSVANMLASVLSSTGLKVGLYTSPHILDFRERMRVRAGGETTLVPEEYVFDFLASYESDMDSLSLSFFEITTGLAFRWFSDMEVDVAVIEVGLGGRLDSTNVITPDLAVVTCIGLDHCDLLGDTLEKIAFEKAGIFKEGVPALVGESLPETRPVFEAKAKDFCPLAFAQDMEPSSWCRHSGILERMDLRGAYQAKNLRTALAAVDILAGIPGYDGLRSSSLVEDAIVHAACRMGFHGRWERLSDNPPVIVDIGHNPPALKENFAQLEKMRENGEYSSLIMVYAIMGDKDLDGVLPLAPQNAAYILTSPSIRRSLPSGELYRRVRAYRERNGMDIEQVYERPGVEGALSLAKELAAKSPRPLVYVGGSAYLVSEAMPLLLPGQGF